MTTGETIPVLADAEARLTIEVHEPEGGASTLARDALAGVFARPKTLPPKYFYDERGSKLFAAICDQPEYYLTRAEETLLRRAAPEVIRIAQPTNLVELGSGDARKIRPLLTAARHAGLRPRYVPLDVSESTLRQSSLALLDKFPWLRIHGIVGDYEQHLQRLPPGEGRLVAFLGSTIGNLDPRETRRFLRRLAARLCPGEHFLLGTDLVKSRRTLEAAYNDAAGITAGFNLNVLYVLNRELGAAFDPEAFEHVAYFNARASRIEMHLRAVRPLCVRMTRLRRTVRFKAGEMLRTEISRKFTRSRVERMLAAAGFDLVRWFVPRGGEFALSLARKAPFPRSRRIGLQSAGNSRQNERPSGTTIFLGIRAPRKRVVVTSSGA